MNTIADCDDLDRLCLCQVDHLGCLTPDGDFVDIERAQPAETFEGWWFIAPIGGRDLEILIGHPAWARPDLEMARTFVAPRLAEIGR